MSARHEAGKYSGKLIGVVFGKTQGNGVPCMVLEFEIFHKLNPNTGEWEPLDHPFQRYCRDMYFNEKGIEYATKKLNALEFSGKPANPSLDDFPNWVTEGPLTLICEHEAGKKSDGTPDTFEKWYPECWGSGSPRPSVDTVDESEMDRINAMFDNYKAQL
jgi:hypothetical protein